MLNPKVTKDTTGRYWLEWTPDATCGGYRFTTPSGTSRTYNPALAKVLLGTSLPPSFTVGIACLDVTERAAEQAPYPAPTPPPPAATVASTVKDGQLVDKAVVWEATVSGLTPVDVNFYVDGLLRTAEHKAPYQYAGDTGTFDPAAYADGPHNLRVQARDADGKTAEWAGQVTTKKPVVTPPPPPPTGTRYFGICPPWPLQAALAGQLATSKQAGLVGWPRIAGGDANALTVQQAGYTRWLVYLGIDHWPSYDEVIAYAKKYPGALIECCNEANLHNVYTAKQTADFHKGLYAAMKAQGVEQQLMLSSVGNSQSGIEHLDPLPWCKALAAAGCVPGAGFTVNNVHMYGPDPDGYNNWMKVWGPGSIQELFGNPPYVISEFGARVGGDVPDEAGQAAAATKWVQRIKTLPDCLGGNWFCLLDQGWSGFGVVRTDGTHRPAFDALRTAVGA